ANTRPICEARLPANIVSFLRRHVMFFGANDERQFALNHAQIKNCIGQAVICIIHAMSIIKTRIASEALED
ncbi:MAG: hypothetical protein NTX50_22620, partial [Candidatus Sumerlaeota bacterium]|nr:hypothetical protein [Candidatus Sumerlaeota bacterium]